MFAHAASEGLSAFSSNYLFQTRECREKPIDESFQRISLKITFLGNRNGTNNVTLRYITDREDQGKIEANTVHVLTLENT